MELIDQRVVRAVGDGRVLLGGNLLQLNSRCEAASSYLVLFMEESMKHKGSSPALRQLDALVGEWRMEASIGGQAMARGTTTFTWLEGGAFLVQHADADPPLPTTPPEWLTNSPFPLITIIALDDASGTFCYAYADARGVRRVYQMRLSDGVWEIWGRSGPEFYQRFRGTFSQDGNTITSRWERSRDGSTWERDFDGTYVKVR